MLKLMIRSTKVLLLALWAACVLSLLSIIPEPYARTVLVVGAIVLLIHFAEYLMVRSKVAERRGGNTGFIGTMVFGFGYWLPVLKST
jgi:uncharacterized protein YhhL (DUF1145 family)